MAIQLITIDPAHFHAALIHKEMVDGVDPRVQIFAPLGDDLVTHLGRLAAFNQRPHHPTSWEVEVHARPDYLSALWSVLPGNVAVLAGRNHAKIDTMLVCVEAGLHVLADKPWIIQHTDLPKLNRLLEMAAQKGVIVFDIMTERHEITSILQRELVRDPDVFGSLRNGDATEPAVVMESIHALRKTVAGVPLKRPAAFFDIAQQGEGLTDVGTHLVDLTFWIIAPEQAIEFERDVQVISAERWPTLIEPDAYQSITGEPVSEEALRDGLLPYWCNNRVHFGVRGHHVLLDIRWEVELAAGDTHNAEVRGTRSRIRISQAPDRPNQPELDILPNRGDDRPVIRSALERRLRTLAPSIPDLDIAEHDDGFRVLIPQALRIGHEAHFAQVTSEFLRYVKEPAALPAWELANVRAKYAVTTLGVELARRGHSMA